VQSWRLADIIYFSSYCSIPLNFTRFSSSSQQSFNQKAYQANVQLGGWQILFYFSSCSILVFLPLHIVSLSSLLLCLPFTIIAELTDFTTFQLFYCYFLYLPTTSAFTTSMSEKS